MGISEKGDMAIMDEENRAIRKANDKLRYLSQDKEFLRRAR